MDIKKNLVKNLDRLPLMFAVDALLNVKNVAVSIVIDAKFVFAMPTVTLKMCCTR